MTSDTKHLRYDGGGTLTFHEPPPSGQGRAVRRTVRHGDTFDTDPDTAATLLDTDPGVIEVDAEGEAIEEEADGSDELPNRKGDLEELAAAEGIDLSDARNNDERREAILAARAARTGTGRPTESSPHPSSSEAEAGAAPPPSTGGGIEADSVGTDATGKTVGGPESAQVGTAGSTGTTSASAPRSGAVNLGDIPASGVQGPERS